MLEWIKKHSSIIITGLVIVGVLVYCYGCESKVRSLIDYTRYITRQELQLELDQLIGSAELRMMSLDKQDALRTIILQNAFILVQGLPLNPFGIITAIAAIYGVTQGTSKVTKVVKKARNKGNWNNG